MSRGEQIAAGVAGVLERIRTSCERVGRDPGDVTLVAVTKTWPVSDIELVAAAGIREVGENRHQDARAKAAVLPDLCWHFLGQLQSNKAKAVAVYASVVESVDRAELLGPLSRGALEAGRELEILLQLSLDGDTSRGGARAADLPALADQVAATEGLRLSGLMTVAPLGMDVRAAFAQAREVAECLREAHPQARQLSAGMSADFEIGVEEGATIVRVGSAIFGGREV